MTEKHNLINMSKLLLSYHIFIFVLLSSSLHTACTNGNSEPPTASIEQDAASNQENYGDQNSITVYENLELIWNDEFDYDGRPDESKWHHQTFAPNGGSWFNEELQHYVNNEQTTYVDNGSLKIVARNQNYATQNTTKNYTSARLNSKGSFQYGRVDVRAKLPQGEGTWPAIWTLGTNINEAGGITMRDQNGWGSVGWPANYHPVEKLDIMEHLLMNIAVGIKTMEVDYGFIVPLGRHPIDG